MTGQGVIPSQFYVPIGSDKMVDQIGSVKSDPTFPNEVAVSSELTLVDTILYF